ncbi:hypothetical protein ACFVVQ_12125 [Paenibacillus chitinolyticus]|uniref:hypothetical protein n=1 Tax=Paenibacillus chitinolyticus TaxID=79263 RepID=UPI0036DA0C42
MGKRMRYLHRHKHPLSKIPAEEMESLTRILLDDQTISVFCDYSGVQNQTLGGMGVCIVGDNETSVHSKLLYSDHINANVYGEIKAAIYGIEVASIALEKYGRRLTRPSNVIFFTDCLHLKVPMKFKKEYIIEAKEEFSAALEMIARDYPMYKFDLQLIGEGKKHNMYYKAAHNAARKVIKRNS